MPSAKYIDYSWFKSPDLDPFQCSLQTANSSWSLNKFALIFWMKAGTKVKKAQVMRLALIIFIKDFCLHYLNKTQASPLAGTVTSTSTE